MKARYTNRAFGPDILAMLAHAEQIATSYSGQGYDLTLRQMYYQFIARDLFPNARRWTWTGTKWVRDPNGTKNADPNYKWLGEIVNDGRYAGVIDWDHITDRTRNLSNLLHFDDPADRIRTSVLNYSEDLWGDQENRVEVWVEKEALSQVVQRATNSLDCAWMACRGYMSSSEIYVAAQRLREYQDQGQSPVVIHLGDHDPSGIDMSRDIEERLWMLMCDPRDYRLLCEGVKEEWRQGATPADVPKDDLEPIWDGWCNNGEFPRLTVERIALNMDQIRQYKPPPSPAKITDSRAETYIKRFGNDSWELDALEPATLNALIRERITAYMDIDQFNAAHRAQEHNRTLLQACSDQWGEIAAKLQEGQEEPE